MTKDCIFCKIAKGKIPCYKVYEDKRIIAFLDVNPIAMGHTFIIPKKHYESIFDCKGKLLENMIKVTQLLSVHYKEKLGCTGVNLLNSSGKSAEQEIPHIHFHLVPRFDEDGYQLTHKTDYQKGDLEVLAKTLYMPLNKEK